MPTVRPGQRKVFKAKQVKKVESPVVDQPGGPGGGIQYSLGFKLPCGTEGIEPVKAPCLFSPLYVDHVSVGAVKAEEGVGDEGVIAAGVFSLFCFTGDFCPHGACSGASIAGICSNAVQSVLMVNNALCLLLSLPPEWGYKWGLS